MASHTWGRIVVLCVAVLLGSAVSNAAQVFENPWNSAATDAGAFSQANQIFAGAFSLAGGAGVDRATWYGTMLDPDPLDTGDTWAFDIVFRTETGSLPGTAFSTSSVVASVTDTGANISGERVYLFDASFPDVALAGFTPYFMSVINTGTQNTFRWNLGLDATYPAYYSDNGGATWQLDQSRPIVNFALYDDGAAPTVPAPAALLLAGIGAGTATWLRRRRTL